MPTVQCKCGSKYHANDAHIGKKLKCGKCGTLLDIVAEPQSGGAQSNFTWTQVPPRDDDAAEVEIDWGDEPPRRKKAPPRGGAVPPQWDMPPQRGERAPRRDAPPPYREARRRPARDYDDEYYDEPRYRDDEPKDETPKPPEPWDPAKGLHPVTRKALLYAGAVMFLLFLALMFSVISNGAKASRDENPSAEPG